jgi:RsiW-degrading membrane proteinase PrsW (M82 family)
MFAVISAGIAPGIALLSFFYLKDQYESEPISMVVRTFIFGALLVFPVMVLQFGFREELLIPSWADAYIIAGLLEEFFKWFILFYTAYQHMKFNDLYDGIVYSVAVSLGFATVENVLYLFAHGLEAAIGRALLPVSSHALYGVIMGYYLGKGKFSRNRRHKTSWLCLSLVAPVLLHGTYNYILLSLLTDWLFIMIPFMAFLWWLGLRKVKLATAKKVPSTLNCG